ALDHARRCGLVGRLARLPWRASARAGPTGTVPDPERVAQDVSPRGWPAPRHARAIPGPTLLRTLGCGWLTPRSCRIAFRRPGQPDFTRCPGSPTLDPATGRSPDRGAQGLPPTGRWHSSASRRKEKATPAAK